MEQYIRGLINDIEEKILIRWNECPPHHYRAGHAFDKIESPPKNWIKPKQLSPELSIDIHLKELNDWEMRVGEKPMYELLNIMPEAFPPVEQLTNDQIEVLLASLCRLWIAFNFYPAPPASFPHKKLYGLMLTYMHEPNQLHNQSATIVDFCGYYPPECPFGLHCQCIAFEDEDEDETT